MKQQKHVSPTVKVLIHVLSKLNQQCGGNLIGVILMDLSIVEICLVFICFSSLDFFETSKLLTISLLFSVFCYSS